MTLRGMQTEDFAAYAAKIELEFPRERSEEEVKGILRLFLLRLTQECLARGTTLIGHIKLILDSRERGYLAASVTTHDGQARFKGSLAPVREAALILNVLQYGLDGAGLERAVLESAAATLGEGAAMEIEDLDQEHHSHDHDHHHHGPDLIRLD